MPRRRRTRPRGLLGRVSRSPPWAPASSSSTETPQAKQQRHTDISKRIDEIWKKERKEEVAKPHTMVTVATEEGEWRVGFAREDGGEVAVEEP